MLNWIKNLFKRRRPQGYRQICYRYDPDIQPKNGDNIPVHDADDAMSKILSAAMNSKDGGVFGIFEDDHITIETLGVTKMSEYHYLEKGEIVQEDDETDKCVDPWRDAAVWKKVHPGNVGDAAPDPKYPSHRIFRRKL